MTRNESPVFFGYPPDESGRRPNEHALLQYATPSQYEAQQRYYRSTAVHDDVPDQQNSNPPQRGNYERPGHHTQQQYESSASHSTTGDRWTSTQGSGEHMLPESSYGGRRRFEPGTNVHSLEQPGYFSQPINGSASLDSNTSDSRAITQGSGEYTHLRRNYPRQREAQRTSTMYWDCCRCDQRYIDAVYANCIHGCLQPKCNRCYYYYIVD